MLEWAIGASAASRVVAGGRGKGRKLHQLTFPFGVAVSADAVYVSDATHRVVKSPFSDDYLETTSFPDFGFDIFEQRFVRRWEN